MPSRGKYNERQRKNRNHRNFPWDTDDEEQQETAMSSQQIDHPDSSRGERRPYIPREEHRSVSRDDVTNLQETFAPTMQKLKEAKGNILRSAEMMSDLMEHIEDSFKGSLDIVREVGIAWGEENWKTEKIKELEAMNESLMCWQEKKVKPLENQLILQSEKYEKLLSEKEGIEEEYEIRYRNRQAQLQEREQALVQQSTALEFAYQAQREALEKSLEKQYKREKVELVEKNSVLEQQRSELAKKFDSLHDSFEKSERAYASLNKENTTLKFQVKAFEAELGADAEPDDYL